MTSRRRLTIFLSVLLTPIVLVAAFLVGVQQRADASSHREAPSISKDPSADNTDTYVWIPQGVTDRIVLAASWIPLEAPEGGPNYYEWDDDVVYYIHVDNNGDATADVSYRLTSTTSIENPNTFLYNTGPITDINSPNWNRKQRISVVEIEGATQTVLVDNQLTTPANVGPKSIPNYLALESQAIHSYSAPEGTIQVYGGMTDDAFWVDLQVFDLLTLRGQPAPIGYGDMDQPVDSLSGFNVHSLIIEVPIARLTQGGEPVLGVWATAGRVGGPVLPNGADASPEAHEQISRLGMPLVNEVVIPLGLKDTFNTLPPNQDLSVYGLLQESVEDPEVGNLLCALYQVPLPGDADDDCDTEYTAGTPRTGRGDIFDIFLTGMTLANPFTITTAGGPVQLPAGTNVNRPANVQPAEMIRINTAVSGALCHPTPQRLGVLAGDACGFPNGRRPIDDIVEIELLAVAGAAYQVLDGSDTSFSFNPVLLGLLDDGIDTNDLGFRDTFPYFAPAQSGRTHFHQNEFSSATSLSFGNLTIGATSAPWLQVVAGVASVGLVAAFEWFRRRRTR